MAKLLCINSVTHNQKVNSIGDIVGMFDDKHEFSENEKVSFDIIDVPNMKKEEINTELQKQIPVEFLVDEDNRNKRQLDIDNYIKNNPEATNAAVDQFVAALAKPVPLCNFPKHKFNVADKSKVIISEMAVTNLRVL